MGPRGLETSTARGYHRSPRALSLSSYAHTQSWPRGEAWCLDLLLRPQPGQTELVLFSKDDLMTRVEVTVAWLEGRGAEAASL